MSCQSFQRTLCVEASFIARDILLVFILEFLQMLQIVSNWATLKATFITWIAAPQIFSDSQPEVLVPQGVVLQEPRGVHERVLNSSTNSFQNTSK